MSPDRSYRVHTIYEPGQGKLCSRHILAYLRPRPPDWPYCKTYDVMARSGDHAKRIAIALRLEEELAALEAP